MRTSVQKSFLVAIAGPSGAGKTEVALYVERERQDVTVLHLDSYFKDPHTFPKVGDWINWEVPHNIDFEHLYRNLHDLKHGNIIEIPMRERGTQRRWTRSINPPPIIIAEGFLILYDREVRGQFDLTIFIDAPYDAQVQRRLQRDTWDNETYIRTVVIPSFQQYGLPTKEYAHIVVDGSQPFHTVADIATGIIEDEYRKFSGSR